MNIIINGVIVVFVTFRLKKLIRVLIILIAVIALIVILSRKNDVRMTTALPDDYVLVLDAGHGGRDGGAIAADGTKESDINLSIALKTRILADFTGIKTVMTRESDTDGAENGDYSERQNLLNRVDIINGTENAVLISIHQNKFPSDNVRGAEIMYAPTSGSKEFALIMQDNLVSYLDTANRRVAVPAPEKLLITSSINCTGVLAECGFMSCPDEAAKLASDTYQTKISAIFISSFLQFAAMQTAV